MEITTNIHETNGRSVTEVLPDFGLENARRNMIALRVKHGADSPIGHRCSNIIEMLKNGVNPGKQLVGCGASCELRGEAREPQERGGISRHAIRPARGWRD